MSTAGGTAVVKEIQTDWDYGYKISNVYVKDDLKTLMFSSTIPTLTDFYGVDSFARCRNGCPVTPNEYCRCGFNAWHDDDIALLYLVDKWRRRYELRADSMVMQRVGLCGRVFEGTMDAAEWTYWGYRAAQQRVLDVFFGPLCMYVWDCCREAVYLGAFGNAHDPRRKEHLRKLKPVCDMHMSAARDILDPGRLSDYNHVGIDWHYPSEYRYGTFIQTRPS